MSFMTRTNALLTARAIPGNPPPCTLEEVCQYLGHILSEDKSDPREQALISRVILAEMKSWLHAYDVREPNKAY
jgi:hypothetical protein